MKSLTFALKCTSAALLLAVVCATSVDVAAQEQQGAVLRIVGLFPMTGPGASIGEYLRNGVDLAKEEVDQRLGGKLKVEVEILDSKNQPKEGITALQASLASKRPHAIISGLSSVSKAIVPLVEQERIVTIVTTTALTDLPKGTKTVLRVYPTSDDFVRPIAEYAVKHFEKVAVVHIHDDFGDSNQRIFAELVKKAGKEITASEPFELTQSDSRSLVARVLATSPQAVFVTGYGPAFVNMFGQLKEAKKDLPILTEVGFANPAVLTALGNDADGIIFDGTELELTESKVESVNRFRVQYKSRFKSEPYQVAGFAHDSVLLLASGALKGGTFSVPDKSTLVSLSPFQGVMGPIEFDAQGECRVSLRLMTRQNGATVLVAE